jgi:uncharacterized repeat protein (TIGR02543 family)
MIQHVETTNYTLTFNTLGGSEVDQRTIEKGTVIKDLPTSTKDGFVFAGWSSTEDGNNPIGDALIVDRSATYYAIWNQREEAAMIGDSYYTTLAKAVQAASTTGEHTVVKLLKNVTEQITITSGQDIELDLQDYTVDYGNTVITNNGSLKIKNGTIKGTGTSGTINNKGNLTITGGAIQATKTKQAVYNEGGTLNISGDAILTSTSNERSTIHNKANGNVTITGGTIASAGLYAIYNESGTLTIGIKDGHVDSSTPTISGKTYGIAAHDSYSIYDGTITAENNVAAGTTSNTGNTPTISADTNFGKISDIETGYEITTEYNPDTINRPIFSI